MTQHDLGREHTTDGLGLDRRAFIRRASIVGAATVWAAPTVQSLVTPAFAVGTQPGACLSCMSGAVQVVTVAGHPVVFHGATIPRAGLALGRLCSEGQGPVQIEVTAHPQGPPAGQVAFHFSENLQLSATASAPATPGTPSCADHFLGSATDGDGNVLHFELVDDGQPGGPLGTVSFWVTGPSGATLLQAAGVSAAGNLQGGGIRRECSGC